MSTQPTKPTTPATPTATAPQSLRQINPSPKLRFQESNNNISEHRNLVDSRAFQRGVDFAMMEYEMQVISGMTDGNQAAASALKLRGVHEFLQTFRLLSEPVPKLSIARAATDHLPEPPHGN